MHFRSRLHCLAGSASGSRQTQLTGIREKEETTRVTMPAGTRSLIRHTKGDLLEREGEN